jgi:hypothetical protein
LIELYSVLDCTVPVQLQFYPAGSLLDGLARIAEAKAFEEGNSDGAQPAEVVHARVIGCGLKVKQMKFSISLH